MRPPSKVTQEVVESRFKSRQDDFRVHLATAPKGLWTQMLKKREEGGTGFPQEDREGSPRGEAVIGGLQRMNKSSWSRAVTRAPALANSWEGPIEERSRQCLHRTVLLLWLFPQRKGGEITEEHPATLTLLQKDWRPCPFHTHQGSHPLQHTTFGTNFLESYKGRKKFLDKAEEDSV